MLFDICRWDSKLCSLLERLGENKGGAREGQEKSRAMGALCCCFSSDTNLEDWSLRRPDWSCLRNCMPWFFAQYDEVDNQEAVVFPSQVSTASDGGFTSSTSVDTSMPEVFQAPPLPLPYDSNPRYLHSNAGGGPRRENKSGMSHENGAAAVEALSSRRSRRAVQRRSGDGGVDLEQGLKPSVAEKNGLASKAVPKVRSALSMVDDDDVCPTCLDEYTEENPRITTACGHSYHLACIYEWMERSNRCPICDKEMVFNEV